MSTHLKHIAVSLALITLFPFAMIHRRKNWWPCPWMSRLVDWIDPID